MLLLDVLMAIGFAILIFVGVWILFMLIMMIALAAGSSEMKKYDDLNDVPIPDRREK